MSIQILLAEDNPGDVFLVQEALDVHNIDHHLHVVTDGEQALTFLARMGEPGSAPCPDIFLLDLNLPRVDGPTVLREFRKHSSCAQTPVIIVTSSKRQNELTQINALGISQYFHKPSSLAEFLKLGAIVKAVAESAKF